MLEEKIGNFIKKIVIPVVLGIGLAGYISGCGPDDECDIDADCKEGEHCSQYCETTENCSPKEYYCMPTETCHNVCYQK